MSLTDRLTEYISACFTGIWIQSAEHDDALREVAEMCRHEDWRLATWDVSNGLQLPGQGNGQAADAGGSDPLAAIRSLNALASPNGSALLCLVNFHRFLQSAEVVQTLAQQITTGKQNRTFVLILSPIVAIPTELEKLFVVVEHDLPSRQQIAEIARGIATEEGELPEGPELETVLAAASGLTRYESEAAFSLSLVRHKQVRADAVWELKCQTLKKSGLLTLHRGGETFADLGGLDSLKSFCSRALRRQGPPDPLKRARGILLLSPPGCGKSQFAKALGNEVGRPTLCMDIGTLMGSLVGSTEANIRQALRITDAMAPSILFIDEIDKGLSGVASSGQTDSGVSARLFGYFLSWLNDHESDVFVVATSNDISKLPPEFSRSERFDGIFFVDLPGVAQKRTIWRMYVEKFGLDATQPKPVDADWSGAEIRACCRLAALLGVPLVEAAQNVVPVARTAYESVERLRTWASGRCLSADQPGIYTPNANAAVMVKPGRKVRRDPSNN
jgi:hypothetical protein